MKNSTLAWILVALLIFGGGFTVYEMTRGLRNNNPGNIRADGTQWQGMAPTQTDSDFVQFVSAEYGIRALARTLSTYFDNYGLNTVAGIINRWAPPSENDTASYVEDVASQMNVDPNAPLDLTTDLPALVRAIIRHENGVQPYSDQTIANGIAMAV